MRHVRRRVGAERVKHREEHQPSLAIVHPHNDGEALAGRHKDERLRHHQRRVGNCRQHVAGGQSSVSATTRRVRRVNIRTLQRGRRRLERSRGAQLGGVMSCRWRRRISWRCRKRRGRRGHGQQRAVSLHSLLEGVQAGRVRRLQRSCVLFEELRLGITVVLEAEAAHGGELALNMLGVQLAQHRHIPIERRLADAAQHKLLAQSAWLQEGAVVRLAWAGGSVAHAFFTRWAGRRESQAPLLHGGGELPARATRFFLKVLAEKFVHAAVGAGLVIELAAASTLEVRLCLLPGRPTWGALAAPHTGRH